MDKSKSKKTSASYTDAVKRGVWKEKTLPRLKEHCRHREVGVCRLTFETNGLKALYFQGVETKHFQHAVNHVMSTCTAFYLGEGRDGVVRHVERAEAREIAD